MPGSHYDRLSSDLQELSDELENILWNNTPVYHYINKPDTFEIVLQSTVTSTFKIDSNFLLNLYAANATAKKWARAFFSSYPYDLTDYNKVGVMWYNDGSSTGTDSQRSTLYTYTGAVSSPSLTEIGHHKVAFGSFAVPVWDVYDISSLSGEHNIMVEAKDKANDCSRPSNLHVFFIYLWKETEV